MKKSKSILFLIEGETEEKLIKELKLLGKIQYFNFWDTDISKIIARIRADEVYIVYDTDVTTNINRFIKNLKKLQMQKIKFYLLQQTNNLEDEIINCSSCKNIRQIFNSSRTEFKECFLSCNNLSRKLFEIDFSPEKLWTGQDNSNLLQWSSLRRNFSHLTKQPSRF